MIVPTMVPVGMVMGVGQGAQADILTWCRMVARAETVAIDRSILSEKL
ncbi:MAG: hypothetical protein JNM13_02350 [Hyphomicrobiaceae bacterium]|nr:hypothetical protein [Hyphomicrobiaceae bacterium]